MCFITNCSSDDENFSNPNVSEEVLVQAVEYGSNIPLAGVEFYTFSCEMYDIEFGKCLKEVEFSSCVTGTNGKCNLKFPRSNFIRVKFLKDRYWYESSKNKESVYTLVPEASVNIIFATDVEYPSSSVFSITVHGTNRYDGYWIQQENLSSERFTLYGNQGNRIDWVLYENANTSSQVLNSGSFKLNPNRFEELIYSLEY